MSELEKQEDLAHVSCNNEKCPMNEDNECHCVNPVEMFFHPSYMQTMVACWWDDNKSKEEGI